MGNRFMSLFNPRSVQVVAQLECLPPVAASRFENASLKHRFAHPPVWTPEVLREAPMGDRSTVREASVLLAVVPRPEPTLLFTLRSTELPVHAGQVAFPGGKREANDEHAVATALREAHEEIGLSPGVVDVLGTLPPYVTATGFCVTPVVGLVPVDVCLAPDPGEVAQVFEVPLHFLMDPANHLRQQLNHNGALRHWYAMPYHLGGAEFYIWGATAGMLRNLYHFLSA
jgi:8-oxo-dGTP pyrophosphatase MutT (NUDIX family)